MNDERTRCTYKCAYWDEDSLIWIEFDPISHSQDFIQCQTDHLTNFAALFVSIQISTNS